MYLSRINGNLMLNPVRYGRQNHRRPRLDKSGEDQKGIRCMYDCIDESSGIRRYKMIDHIFDCIGWMLVLADIGVYWIA